VQRGIQQSQKSSQEVLGVALSFADIREELINNRVDTEDRKERLKEQIADPLQKIVAERFPALEKRLAELEKSLSDTKAAAPLSNAASEEAELLLAELGDVLQKMLDLETYNELLDIVRDLIKEQTDLLDKTRQQKKRQLLELTE
jgi:chemotaxis regulatin CheY-phosphate phosphatase CheZ